MVCHKPPGVPVQTANALRQDMVSILKNRFAEKGERTELYVVHRLDQPVEGVMAFARTKHAASSLSRQVREGGVGKRYLALTEGEWEAPEGVLEDFLLRDGRANASRVVPEGTAGAKRARLFYKVEKIVDAPNGQGKESLLDVRLETGRHHQIRVQTAHAGHPIVGDGKYGTGGAERSRGLALCSVEIRFAHPATGRACVFRVEPKGRWI